MVILTRPQRRALHYLQSVGGKAKLLDIPGGGLTIATLAARGLIGVSIKLTQKARNRLFDEGRA